MNGDEFDKLPIPMIKCELCYWEFYYFADYIAHKDVKHPKDNQIQRPRGSYQTRLSD